MNFARLYICCAPRHREHAPKKPNTRLSSTASSDHHAVQFLGPRRVEVHLCFAVLAVHAPCLAVLRHYNAVYMVRPARAMKELSALQHGHFSCQALAGRDAGPSH